MNLPTIEPVPDENTSLPPARRRRQRRMVVPAGSSERADFIRALALRTVPSFDFFLYSLLAGLTLGAAFLLDSAALVFLAALLAPFMAPVIGVSLGTAAGSIRFVLQSLGSLIIGSLIVFLSGALSGWAVNLLPPRDYLQAAQYSQFNGPFFVVLALGAGLSAYLVARAPNQKPLVSSAAIAYALYLPVGAAGFGFSGGLPGLWPDGITLFIVHLVWAALIGILVLAVLGLRPMNTAGYLLSSVYAICGVAAVFLVYANLPALPGPVLPPDQGFVTAGKMTQQPTPTRSPSPSISPSKTPLQPTPTVTPTRTLVPSRTPTLTITAEPTPVWARISASEGNGALIRKEPDYNAAVVQSLLNGNLVEVLPEVKETGNVTWVHVRTVNGKEGWIVRTLLRTATPAPGW